MTTREVAEWSTIDDSNNFPADEGGHKEKMKRSNVNDANRANMGSIRRWYEDPEWLDLTVGASLVKATATELTVQGGDFTAYFTPDRKVKITESSGGPTYATVVSSAVDGGDTDVILTNFSGPDSPTEIPADPLVVYAWISKDVNPRVFDPDNFTTVPVLTGAAIQDAIDTLEAADGGIILLEPDATYVVDAVIGIGSGTSPGNIRIIGRGATIQAGTGLDTFMLNIEDTPHLDARVAIEDLIFDGNSSAQTGLANAELVRVGSDVSYVWFKNCLFTDSYAHALGINNSSNRIWIEDCAFVDSGEDGIKIRDFLSDVEEIYISRCTFDNPSARSGFTTGSGIHFAGKVSISDCQFINLNHANDEQVGITMAAKAQASPSDRSAHQSTVTGCSFVGTGLNARGIWLRGRENVISACTFRLSGSGSEAIQADDNTGSEESNLHVISGCVIFDAARAIRFYAGAEDIIVTGCKISNSPNPYTDDGIRNKFSSNHITTCTDGVTLDAAAVDPVVSDNIINSSSDDGVTIASGVTRPQIISNAITNASGTNIVDLGSISPVIVTPEHFYRAVMFVGSGDAVALTLEEPDIEYVFPETVVSFSDFADGSLMWLLSDVFIKFGIVVDLADQDFTIRIRWGPNRETTGPATDNLLTSQIILETDYTAPQDIEVDFDNANDMWFAAFNPALDDEIYLTAERTSGLSGQDLILTLEEESSPGLGCFWSVKIRDRSFS